MFFRFCWNTPLGRVSRGFCDWLMCSILGFKELTDSSRSRSPSWRLVLNLGEFISTLLKSKADSTSRRYKKEISKFIDFCNSSNVQPVPPFPVTFIVVYLFKIYQSSNSYASLVMAHAALKLSVYCHRI